MEIIAGIAFVYLIAESFRQSGILQVDRQLLEEYAGESDEIIDALRAELNAERVRRAAGDKRVGRSISFKIDRPTGNNRGSDR